MLLYGSIVPMVGLFDANYSILRGVAENLAPTNPLLEIGRLRPGAAGQGTGTALLHVRIPSKGCYRV